MILAGSAKQVYFTPRPTRVTCPHASCAARTDHMSQVPTAVPIWCLSSVFLAGFALQTARAQSPAIPVPDVTVFASPTRLDQIGRVLAPVMVNGQGPFRFIVDTGASQSTISPRLAQTLGVDQTAERPMRVNGITGTADVPSATIHRLQAGDLIIEEAR